MLLVKVHTFHSMVTKPIIFDIRSKPKNISTNTGTKDLRTVSTLRVLHRPDIFMLQICQTLGLDYAERVLPSIGNEI